MRSHMQAMEAGLDLDLEVCEQMRLYCIYSVCTIQYIQFSFVPVRDISFIFHMKKKKKVCSKYFKKARTILTAIIA